MIRHRCSLSVFLLLNNDFHEHHVRPRPTGTFTASVISSIGLDGTYSRSFNWTGPDRLVEINAQGLKAGATDLEHRGQIIAKKGIVARGPTRQQSPLGLWTAVVLQRFRGKEPFSRRERIAKRNG